MTFDPERAWQLADQVAVRPEPFGALVYHFGTRRLSFLKSRALLDVVRSLDAHESARAALAACGVDAAQQPRYEAALARLAETGMISGRAVA